MAMALFVLKKVYLSPYNYIGRSRQDSFYIILPVVLRMDILFAFIITLLHV